MAAPLKIDASDLLGKLHVAAMDKVNSKYKGTWNAIKKAIGVRGIGRFVKSSITNTAFDDKTGKLNIPPNGKAEIRVVASGTGAKNEAKEMFALYMKWFAGIEEDVSKFVKDAGKADSGVSGKNLTIGGQGIFDLTIEYELTSTEKEASKLEKITDKNDSSEKSDNASDNSDASDDSDVINAFESKEQTTEKKNVWESHPFESIFKEKHEEHMVKESNTERFVDEVMKKKNVKAQNTLESILKAKVEKRVKETLEDFEIASKDDSKKNS